MRPDKRNLSSLIDELWKKPNEREELARQFIADLNFDSRLILSAWDTAATFGPPSGKLHLIQPNTMQVADSWGKVFLVANQVEESNKNNEQILISYYELNLCVVSDKSSPTRPKDQFIHDFKSLLIALQFVRDYLDSVLIKPVELRNAEIEAFAASLGIESSYFRRLVVCSVRFWGRAAAV